MESLAGLVVLECRTLQVHSDFCRPDRGGVRSRTPPDPLAQAFRMRFEAQQSRRIWKHRAWVRLGKALTTQQVEKDLRMTPPHLGVSLALGRLITEIAPAIDHLLGRPSAAAEFHTPAAATTCTTAAPPPTTL